MTETMFQSMKASQTRLHGIYEKFRDPNFCGLNVREHRNVARLQTCIRQIMITMHPYALENNTNGSWISDLSELCDALLLEDLP